MVRTRARHGFTLVELLVALVFMSFAAAAMLSVIGSAHWQSGTAKYRAIALGLAQDAIEEQWVESRTGSLAATGPATVQPSTDIPIKFEVTRTTTHVTTGGISGLYRVNVVVRWTNPNGSAESVELETMIRDLDE